MKYNDKQLEEYLRELKEVDDEINSNVLDKSKRNDRVPDKNNERRK